MNLKTIAALFVLTAAPAIAQDETNENTIDSSIIPADIAANAIALRERALNDNLSVDIRNYRGRATAYGHGGRPARHRLGAGQI